MDRIKQFYKNNKPLIIYMLVVFFMHILMHENEILDAKRYFATVLDQYDMRTFLSLRYHTWSSRIVIEACLAMFSRNLLIWGILDFLVFVLLYLSLKKLLALKADEPVAWILVGCIFMYYMGDMSSAGWVATLMNYMWPLSFGLFAAIPLMNGIRKEKTHPVIWVLSFPALIYAANMEQMAALLFAFYSIALIYIISLFVRKTRGWEKTNRTMFFLGIVQWVLTLAELLFILTCPGNAVRAEEEILKSEGNLGFGMNTMLDKFLSGLDHCMTTFLNSNLLLLEFALVVSILLFIRYKRTTETFCGIILIAFSLIVPLSNSLESVGKLMTDSSMRPGIHNFTRISGYAVPAIWMLFMMVMGICLVMLCTSRIEAIFLLLLLAGGFVSKIIIGFSPSLISSASRTQIYLQFAVVFLIVYLIKKYEAELTEKPALKNALYIFTALISVIGVMNSMVRIINFV
ncbi:MAG: hypothetical protein K6F37_02510 [Lachnospiraceae bacterium]|nr:hypothetical protein [Lachnospiraceae bacterium]